MIRSMFSAISGMLNHQLRMDVIGNNLSNVNTVGYKTRRTTFSEAFAQVSRTASASAPVGLSVGLGSNVSGTDTLFTQGAFQRTNLPSDIGISGEGFFTVTGNANSTGERYFTRAGDFVLDVNGYLRTADGFYLQGYTSNGGFATNVVAGNSAVPAAPEAEANISSVQIAKTIAGTEAVVSYSIGQDGAIILAGENGTTRVAGYMALADFGNNNGLDYKFNSFYQSSQASGTQTYYQANTGPVGGTQQGVLELSNVDIASQFADMVVTQRGFDANAKLITTSDEMLQTIVNIKR
jgi:flagellar hook protein FlgE